MGKDLSHPATNGSTKRMILLTIIFIFILAAVSVLFAFIGFHTITGPAIGMWIIKSLFGGIGFMGLGGLIAITKSFFDARSKAQKDADKLALKVAKYEHKEEMYRIKTRQDSLKKKNKD